MDWVLGGMGLMERFHQLVRRELLHRVIGLAAVRSRRPSVSLSCTVMRLPSSPPPPPRLVDAQALRDKGGGGERGGSEK